MGGGASKQRVVAPAPPTVTVEPQKVSAVQTQQPIVDPVVSSAPDSVFPGHVPEASKQQKQSLKPRKEPARTAALVVVESTPANTIENLGSPPLAQQIPDVDDDAVFSQSFEIERVNRDPAPPQPEDLSRPPLAQGTSPEIEKPISHEEERKPANVAISEGMSGRESVESDIAITKNSVPVKDASTASLQKLDSDRPPPKLLGAFGGDGDLEPAVGIRGLLGKKKKPTNEVIVIKPEVKFNKPRSSDLERMASMESLEPFETSFLENAVLAAPGFASEVTSPKKTTTNPVQLEDMHPFGFFE
ncbi:hypothetical protein BC830DRAFT_1219144 [Chytriomyces sp. MP71]|nr:hypothetical protein BC830DRAFT_1219144 [Chytriomyces sp. MP71]